MKKLFQLIKNKDLAGVKELIKKDPSLVFAVSKQPPAKDDGQSPLQIALKYEAFEIAELLIKLKADVNFIESEDCVNEWRAPVLHDAINAAVMCCRWNTYDKNRDIVRPFSTERKADAAFLVLKKIIAKGADVNATDSYGNTPIWRFCLQAVQILPSFNFQTKEVCGDKILTKELEKDLKRIFVLLKKSGTKVKAISPQSKETIYKTYKGHPIMKIIK